MNNDLIDRLAREAGIEYEDITLSELRIGRAIFATLVVEELAKEFEAHALELEASTDPLKKALAKIARGNAAYVREWVRRG